MPHRATHGISSGNSMLKHLFIKNYTLIEELDIDLHPGFSVITGETGAGKSIILGAIVDVHSQHQNLLLNKQDFQLNVVDVIAYDAKELATYQQTYNQYQATARELETLKDDIERNRQNLDFLQFQCDELTQANLEEGEQEELEQRSDVMSHSEEIKSALYEADNALSAEVTGIIESLQTAWQEMNG